MTEESINSNLNDFLLSKENIFIYVHNIIYTQYTVITRNLYNRKTTLKQSWSSFDVVTKHTALHIKSLIKWNGSVYIALLLCLRCMCTIKSHNLSLKSLPIPEFSGYLRNTRWSVSTNITFNILSGNIINKEKTSP